MIQDYPTFIESSKERFELLLNSKTFWIHFDGDEDEHHYKIPTIENLSYLFILLHSHHKECVNQSFERLQKLLCFYVDGMGFPEHLHDFPTVKSFNDQIFILLLLKRIDEKYGKYFKEDLTSRLRFVLADLESILKEKITNPIQRAKFSSFENKFENDSIFSTKDLGEALLISGLDSLDLKHYHVKTQTVKRALFVEKRVGSIEEMSPYHLIAEFCLKRLNVKKIPNSMLRYLPLLESKWLDQTFEMDQSDASALQILEGLTIKYPQNYSAHLWSHFNPTIVDFDESFEITINYPDQELDEKESLVEVALFFTKDKEFNFLVGEKKRTTFYLNEKVLVVDSKGHEIFELTFESEGGTFMGTYSFGNRPTQKRKTYTPYDQVIGIRTIKRSPHAKLQIKMRYCPSWGVASNSWLSIATPIA